MCMIMYVFLVCVYLCVRMHMRKHVYVMCMLACICVCACICMYMCTMLSSHPYLGIKLDTTLTWANHITDIASKSSKVLGMIKRTLGPCKPDVKETAYNILVRPQLEYVSYMESTHHYPN